MRRTETSNNNVAQLVGANMSTGQQKQKIKELRTSGYNNQDDVRPPSNKYGKQSRAWRKQEFSNNAQMLQLIGTPEAKQRLRELAEIALNDSQDDDESDDDSVVSERRPKWLLNEDGDDQP